MSRFPPGLQPFAVNNGLDDPNHKLKRRKYQIPVERHANPHAGRRYDREQQLCADVYAEEQLCVAPVPEAERQQQDSLKQQRRQQRGRELFEICQQRISGFYRIIRKVTGEYLLQLCTLHHLRKVYLLLRIVINRNPERVRRAEIAEHKRVLVRMLVKQRRLCAVQHGIVPAVHAVALQRIQRQRRAVNMIPLDIVDASLGYLARNEQVNIIIAVRRILHLNGDLRFRARIRACGDRQYRQQERGYAQAGFPLSFHGGHPFSY